MTLRVNPLLEAVAKPPVAEAAPGRDCLSDSAIKSPSDPLLGRPPGAADGHHRHQRLLGRLGARQFTGDPPDVEPKQHVLIKAAREVRSREVARVARAVAKANTLKTIQMHFAVREIEQ